MQSFKIENYEREHGVGTFVSFRRLSQEEAEGVKNKLRNRLNLPEIALATDILKAIQERSILVEGQSADRDDFNLLDMLVKRELFVPETVYLNWDRFEEIDEIGTHQLSSCFGDIWYPSADDVELIHPEFLWVLSVHHSGMLKALSFIR